MSVWSGTNAYTSDRYLYCNHSWYTYPVKTQHIQIDHPVALQQAHIYFDLLKVKTSVVTVLCWFASHLRSGLWFLGFLCGVKIWLIVGTTSFALFFPCYSKRCCQEKHFHIQGYRWTARKGQIDPERHACKRWTLMLYTLSGNNGQLGTTRVYYFHIM